MYIQAGYNIMDLMVSLNDKDTLVTQRCKYFPSSTSITSISLFDNLIWTKAYVNV